MAIRITLSELTKYVKSIIKSEFDDKDKISDYQDKPDKRFLAFTEDVTMCDYCGKTDLRGTYVISIDDEIGYYGSTCAFKIGLSYDRQKDIKKDFNKEKKLKEQLKLKLANVGHEYFNRHFALREVLIFCVKNQLPIRDILHKYVKPGGPEGGDTMYHIVSDEFKGAYRIRMTPAEDTPPEYSEIYTVYSKWNVWDDYWKEKEYKIPSKMEVIN